MNKKLENSVNEILGLDPVSEDITENEKQLVVKELPKVPRVEDKDKGDIDNDYTHSRENYYNLIDKGNEAIEGILEIAKEGQHPRAYEVAGQLIANVATTVDKLQDLQKKLKDLKAETKSADTKIQNALFVGSTAELQKMLNRKETPESRMEKGEENETIDGKAS